MAPTGSMTTLELLATTAGTGSIPADSVHVWSCAGIPPRAESAFQVLGPRTSQNWYPKNHFLIVRRGRFDMSQKLTPPPRALLEALLGVDCRGARSGAGSFGRSRTRLAGPSPTIPSVR